MKLVEGIILTLFIVLTVIGLSFLLREPYDNSQANSFSCKFASHYKMELYQNGKLKALECWSTQP